MPPSPSVPIVYATDEDCYNEANADFGVIVPTSNRLAAGVDGVFSSGDLWTLHSASNNFAAQGVVSGNVVHLTEPKASFNPSQYLAVDSATSTTITLRRCGFGVGEGLPPSPAAGLTAVRFLILTLRPQIENTAYTLNEEFALDPLLPNRAAAMLYDARPFRRLTVLRVYYNLYAALNRAKAGDFADKVKYYRDEYTNALDATTVRWGPQGTSEPVSTRMGTRMDR